MGFTLALALLVFVHPQVDGGQETSGIDRVVELVTKGNKAQHAQSGDYEGPYREAIEAGASLAPEARRLVGDYLALAHHGVATAERDRGEIMEALSRVQSAEAELELTPPFRALLLSMSGDLFLEFGVPDRAEEPNLLAFELALQELQSERPNWGVVFLVHARRFKQLLAVERYRDAADVVEGLKADLDWDTVFEGRDPGGAARERATLDTYAGVAWAALAATEPEVEARAREALERVLAEPRALQADRFTAAGRLAHLAIRRGDLASAADLLAMLRLESQEPSARVLPREEATWLASLEAALAERAGVGRAEALERLGHSFRDLMEERRDAQRPSGVGYFRYARARLVLQELVALSTPKEGLAWMIEAHAVGTLWQALGKPRPSTESVLARIVSPGIGCIVYVNGESRAQCLVVDEKGGVGRFDLGDAHEVTRLAREFMAALQQDPAAAGPARARTLATDGAALAAILFPEPVRKSLRRWSAVRIVGRDLLEFLALEALPVLDDKALGLTHAVSDLPSLAIAVALAERVPPGKPGPPLLVVVPAVSGAVRDRFGLTPLELSKRSVEALRESADRPLEFLREEEATVAGLEQALAREPAWLHLFAHGIRDDTRELRPIVVLAPDTRDPDGYLTVESVRGMRSPELVVLSVCGSGDGGERTGDSGAGHFGGAFLAAGARCVLLSPEQVRLSAALAMGGALYASLRDDHTPAEALRRARVVLAADARWADPFHWALMQAYGFDSARPE